MKMVWHCSAEDQSVDRSDGIWGKKWEVYFSFKLMVSGAKAFSTETVFCWGQGEPAKRDA